MKPQSMATARNNFQKLVFSQANQKLVVFLDELQKLAKDAFGIAAHAIIEQFIYAKMPTHLKKSKHQAHLENGTYEQIVTHLERELQPNSLEDPDELQIYTLSHNTTNTNADRHKPTFHHCKKPGHYRNQFRLWKKQQEQTEKTQNTPGNKKVTLKNLTQTTSTIFTTTTTKTVTELKGSQKLFIHAVSHMAKRTTPQRDVMFEPMQQKGPFPGRANRKDRVDIINRTPRTVLLIVSWPQPNILTRNATLSLRNCD